MSDRRPHQRQFTGNNPPVANDEWSHSILAARFDYQHGRLTNVNNGRGATATHGTNEPTRGNPPHPMPVQYPLSNTSTTISHRAVSTTIHHPSGAQRFPHGHSQQQPHDAIALNPPPVMPRLPAAAAAAAPGPAQQQQQPSPCREAIFFPCCNTRYKSEFARRRHQRESAACPYWTGEALSFSCPFCATQPKRRAALVQHVQERHKQTNQEAKDLVHAWYNRDGSVRGV